MKKSSSEWRVADQRDRHAKAGNTVFLQEPNVKTGCGGLRDYQNLLWVGKVKRGLENTQGFVDAQLLTATERKQLDRAYDFLLRVRTELHYQQKRAGDVLTLRLQGQIADSFRYQHRTILRRMEAFMRDYYEHSSLLYNLGNTLCNRLCGGGRPAQAALGLPAVPRHAPRGNRRLRPRERRTRGGLQHHVFRRAAAARARLPPRAAAQRRAGRGIETAAAAAALHGQPAFIYQTAVRETLMAILSRKGQVGHALRTMHELGFLGRFFPEFRPLTCLVQHEFFHRYTADEHTLVCIEMLDLIIDAAEPPFSKYKALLQQAAAAAAPLPGHAAARHRAVGKLPPPRRGQRGQRGARGAAHAGSRAPDLSTLVFLVDHHLTMSEIARRKNLDNEETIIEFARIVQTPERLDLLMLLTFADTQGTGSGRTYSDWKDLLLWQLYHRTPRGAQRLHRIRGHGGEGAARDAAAAAEKSRPPARPGRGRGPFREPAAELFRGGAGGPDPRAHRHRARLPQVPAHERGRLARAGDPLAQLPRAGPFRSDGGDVGPRAHLRRRDRLLRRLRPDHSQGRHFHPRRRHRDRDVLRRDRKTRGGDRSARPRRLREKSHPGDGHGAVRFRETCSSKKNRPRPPAYDPSRKCPRASRST